ncbi:hypothetical protein HPB50_011727 [Hyalomma asiaticum]|uniref:Uncharacterized protein n=1 Tax=Hyalomma asiaticum TaxID=266040 RepID=A0ACB7SIS8_HYAAI|nr:hypothetical protein HPB50_028331 [Hyalomma asiaticum]KAH6933052.1 hypothetical protein HPB50_011727 [Hyalomma asiaticum]
MAAASAPQERLTWKFPVCVPSSAIIGDSQLKYVHNHFDPSSPHSPAFICQPGAKIADIGNLLDFVPKGVSTLILHVGTNDIATEEASKTFGRYVALVERIRSDRPDIAMVFVSLVLPRGPNERLWRPNWHAVTRFNREATKFNRMLVDWCSKRKGVFYLDHVIDAFPPWTVLAADGVHPNFVGVSLLAWNYRNLLLHLRRPYMAEWLDHALQPEGPGQRGTQPSYSQAVQCHLRGNDAVGDAVNVAVQTACETADAHSTGQHAPRESTQRNTRQASRVPRPSTPTKKCPPQPSNQADPGQRPQPAVPEPAPATTCRTRAAAPPGARRDTATPKRYDLRRPCGPVSRVCTK